jgi:four helix bundle protein
MGTHRNLRLLDAARSVADGVNRMSIDAKQPILNAGQLRRSANSILANISEALGHDEGPDRHRFFRHARGSADETNEHLRHAFKAEQLRPKVYYPFHNRLVVIVRMLNGLMA